MKSLSELFWLSAVVLTTVKADDVRLPPSIHIGPSQVYIYRENAKVTLPCESLGYSSPTYSWEKNNASFSMTGIATPDPTIGSIEISQATKVHEGYYQCLATNPWGRAISDIAHLQMAVLGSYDANDPKINYTAKANDMLRLRCNAPNSIPQAKYTWSYNTTTVFSQTEVILTQTVQIDINNGDLVFARVDPSEPANRLYRCNVYNDKISSTNSGSYSRIMVTGSITGSAPQLQFSTPSPVIAFQSQQTILRCFFSGSDSNGQGSIVYSWTYNGQNGLPPGWNYADGVATSPRSGTDPSAAGTYVCTGRNTLGTASATFQLVVRQIPDFGSDLDNQPHDMNVTEGATVAIRCLASADPPASIRWSVNKTIFDRSNLPPKFSLSSDLTTLAISNVCKECADGSTDLRNIECNASNIYGYAFAQGYFNVLLATQITSNPVTVQWSPNANYQFDCQGTCDISTPCNAPQWTFKDEPVQEDGSRLFVDDNGSLHIETAADSDAGNSRIGTYTCNVSNGYSSKTMDAVILGDGPVHTASLWWVGLLVALLVLLLLLLLLLCCFLCCCGEGKSYPVDERERENGNNPEKELKIIGFQEHVITKSATNVDLPTYTATTATAERPQPPTNVNLTVGTHAENTYYVTDPAKVYLPTYTTTSARPEPSVNDSIDLGGPDVNAYYVKDQGNVHLPNYTVGRRQVQLAAPPNGLYYVDGTGYQIRSLSHGSQEEVFNTDDLNVWSPYGGVPQSEV